MAEVRCVIVGTGTLAAACARQLVERGHLSAAVVTPPDPISQLMLENEFVGMVRLRNRIIEWDNRALAQIFGYAPGELRGVSMRELYLDKDAFDRIDVEGYAALSSQGRFRTQIQMRKKDGSPIWVDLSGTQVTEDESLWLAVDVEALKKSEEVAFGIAFRDSLTGLPNRRLFEEKLSDCQAFAARSGSPAAVCYLDLDGFKAVNDRFGHEAGDQVLQEVAHRIERLLRGSDVVARLGGDEFALLLPACGDVAAVRAVLERCLYEIERPVQLDSGDYVSVGASIGIVLVSGNEPTPQVMRDADAAMYKAKRAGKGQMHFHAAQNDVAAAEPERGRPVKLTLLQREAVSCDQSVSSHSLV